MSTATTYAAREDARRREAESTVVDMPIIPATSAEPPAGIDAADLTWSERIPGGRYSTLVLARGTRLRLTNLEGHATAHLMLWRADAPWERFNAADTMKIPWQGYLRVGTPLLTDQGRVLATVVDATHAAPTAPTGTAAEGDSEQRIAADFFCGATTLAHNIARYGEGEAQSTSPAGRELLKLAALKQGLGPQDVALTFSLFHATEVGEDGSIVSAGQAAAGATVDLVFHLPTIVAIANAAHPLDPAEVYPTTTLGVQAWHEPTVLDELAQRATTSTHPLYSPEYRRAFHNSEDIARAAGLV